MVGYIGLLRKQPEGEYWASFPDFPGVASSGHSPEEAEALATKHLRREISQLRRHGDPFPATHDLEELRESVKDREAMVFRVSIAGARRRP